MRAHRSRTARSPLPRPGSSPLCAAGCSRPTARRSRRAPRPWRSPAPRQRARTRSAAKPRRRGCAGRRRPRRREAARIGPAGDLDRAARPAGARHRRDRAARDRRSYVDAEGYVFSESASLTTGQHAHVVFKVPPDRFTGVIAGIGRLGTLVHRQHRDARRDRPGRRPRRAARRRADERRSAAPAARQQRRRRRPAQRRAAAHGA